MVCANYPLPLIEDQFELRSKRYFNAMDLKDGFYHIAITSESITAIYCYLLLLYNLDRSI